MIEDLLQQLPHWAQNHPLLFGGLVFLVAFLESLAVIGFVVPGVVMMFVAGALIAAGGMTFVEGVAWAASGAISGDLLSYWLGRRYRQGLLGFWPFCRYPALVEGGVAFFRRYGGWSVAFGRFVGPVRAIIPLVAGMMGMPGWRFVVANVLSGIAWAVVYLLPGMVFALSMELAAAVAWRLAVLLLLLVAGAALFGWGVKHLFLWFSGHAKALLAWSLSWALRHPTRGRLVTALTDPAHPEAAALSLMSLILLLGATLFFLMLGWVAQLSGAAELDRWLLGAIQALRAPLADNLLAAFTRIADGPLLSVWVVTLGALAYRRGDRRLLWYGIAALGFAFCLTWFLKLALAIPRPQVVVFPPASPAFPSGHTMNAVVAFGFWAVTRKASAWSPRWLFFMAAGVLVFGVGFSRVYLGVHWPSDVLASLALGSAWVALLGIAYHRHAATRASGGWGGLLLLALLWAGWLWGFDHNAAPYEPYRPIATAQVSAWGKSNFESATTPDAQEAALRFAGDLGWLSQRLANQGWRVRAPFQASELLQLLSPRASPREWPVIPRVVDGRYPDLVLVRPMANGRRAVLRWWRARVTLAPGETPVWWGEMTIENERRYLGLIGLPVREQVGLQRAREAMQPLEGLREWRTGGYLYLRQARDG